MKEYYQAIERFHQKFQMKGTNNEDMSFRLNLLIEELGELAECVTKGHPRKEMIEENIDLLNLVIGNFVSLGVSFEEADAAFWEKLGKIMNRKKKKVGRGKFRVSEFRKK